ncbi:MAG: hypothetical protein U9Q81_23200 [Pseudomonadota bacterium]|nr:hypothetical protein [Pseudomonadota bacterium]
MKEQDFLDFVRHGITEGQTRLAGLLRSLVRDSDQELAEGLESVEDRVFLEPMLCAFFHANSPRIPLQQILYASVPEDRRPDCVTVAADRHGTVYIPNLGYFFTRQTNKRMDLHWNGSARAAELHSQGRSVPSSFRNVSRINGTQIEVYQTLPQLLEPFFVDPTGSPVRVELVSIAAAKREYLENACLILREHYVHYFKNILDTIRGVLIYSAPHPYSFATMGAHGVAFLNSRPDSMSVFFLEDMLHQCSHVIFNAATLDKSRLFEVDPDTPLSSLSALDDYHGTLYEAFHGLFTQTNINRCLNICREAEVFSGRDRHELEGRISDNMKRFGGAIHAIGQRDFYTELGWQLYDYFRNTFVFLYRLQRELIEQYDTSNQPYIFNYGRFLEKNPLPKEVL